MLLPYGTDKEYEDLVLGTTTKSYAQGRDNGGATLPTTRRKRLGVPKRHKLLRLVRLLHACTLSRPASLFTWNLPPLYRQVIFFDLPKTEKYLSNEAYNAYELSLESNYDDPAYSGKSAVAAHSFTYSSLDETTR